MKWRVSSSQSSIAPRLISSAHQTGPRTREFRRSPFGQQPKGEESRALEAMDVAAAITHCSTTNHCESFFGVCRVVGSRVQGESTGQCFFPFFEFTGLHVRQAKVIEAVGGRGTLLHT